MVPEQIVAHKERKVKGKVIRRYLVKFQNYSPMDAKWMEEGDLANNPQILDLYLAAFQLEPTVSRLPGANSDRVASGALPHAEEGGTSGTS